MKPVTLLIAILAHNFCKRIQIKMQKFMVHLVLS